MNKIKYKKKKKKYAYVELNFALFILTQKNFMSTSRN